jgi:hypothetical protein
MLRACLVSKFACVLALALGLVFTSAFAFLQSFDCWVANGAPCNQLATVECGLQGQQNSVCWYCRANTALFQKVCVYCTNCGQCNNQQNTMNCGESYKGTCSWSGTAWSCTNQTDTKGQCNAVYQCQTTPAIDVAQAGGVLLAMATD